MAEVGWDDVTYLRKKAPKATEKRSQQAVNAAQRSGQEVATSKKYFAGQNKQHSASKSTARLDRETEELKHCEVGLDTGRLIQQARQAKNMNQKELATKINEKPQVVNDYEAGKAIPNNQVMSKLERTLGVKLRGKDRGTPLAPKKK